MFWILHEYLAAFRCISCNGIRTASWIFSRCRGRSGNRTALSFRSLCESVSETQISVSFYEKQLQLSKLKLLMAKSWIIFVHYTFLLMFHKYLKKSFFVPNMYDWIVQFEDNCVSMFLSVWQWIYITLFEYTACMRIKLDVLNIQLHTYSCVMIIWFTFCNNISSHTVEIWYKVYIALCELELHD